MENMPTETKKSIVSKIPGFRSGKWWKKVLASVFYGFMLLFIVALASGDGTPTNTGQIAQDEPQVQESPAESPQEQESTQTNPPAPKEPVEVIEEAAGKHIKDQLTKVEVNDYANDPTKKIVLVYFNGSDNLTANMIRGGMIMDSSYVLQDIFSTGIPIQEATCFISFPMKDQYGNTSEDVIMKIGITGETAKKINWDGISRTDFDKAADTIWMHPALQS